jgi:hypothetical protein
MQRSLIKHRSGNKAIAVTPAEDIREELAWDGFVGFGKLG